MLHAKLNYRKFMWSNTQFAFTATEDPHQPPNAVTPDYDDRKWLFKGIEPQKIAGELKSVPNLPVITVAEDTKVLNVAAKSAAPPQSKVTLAKEDWSRWNDYGIGLFLQGDLKGAAAAFQKAADVDPQNPDGWVNIGRALVQEGDTGGARVVLEKALALKPGLARANFFYARILKEEGDYDAALTRLRDVLSQYPRDRVVRNEVGRILFLQKKYAAAITEFNQTLSIDPEDLQAHYNLMLCYSGMGDEPRANEHKERYLRFKADESSQAITGPYRQAHPEDNNERQSIHEHVSVALTSKSPDRAKSASKQAAELSGGSH
jgi:Tfp pilus assembly protein PilF